MVISREVVGGGHLLADAGPPDALIVPDGLRASQPRLSSQHRRAWLALVADPWVVSTMTQGYRLQFWCRPRVARSPIFTTVANQRQAQTLRMELSTLLEKGAIGEVERSDRKAGFYSRYFLIPKKDGGLRPILDLRGLNK